MGGRGVPHVRGDEPSVCVASRGRRSPIVRGMNRKRTSLRESMGVPCTWDDRTRRDIYAALLPMYVG